MKRLICLLVILFTFATFSQEMKFGIRVNQEQLSTFKEVISSVETEKNNPLFVTFLLNEGWDDLTNLEEVVKETKERNFAINIVLPLPKVDEEKRLIKLTELSEKFKDYVFSFEMILSENDFTLDVVSDPDKLAYTLKRLLLALRVKSDLKVYIGSLDEKMISILKPLYEREFIAYIDGYSTFNVDNLGEASSWVNEFVNKNHLGAPLRLHLKKVKTSLGAETNTMVSLSKGAKEVDIEVEDLENGVKDLIYLRKCLTSDFSPSFEVYGVEIREGEKRRSDIVFLPFLNIEEELQGFYLAPTGAKSVKGNLTMHFTTSDITNPVVFPMPNGEKKKLGLILDEKKNVADIPFYWDGKPLFIIFERFKTGYVGGGETLVIEGKYNIPVEFIIARHQAVEQAQSILLENYTSSAEVNYHFKVPGTASSIDITFINDFLYDRKGGARWVQKEVFVNGAKWKGKKIPELPIIEPEKINTLPLVLTLSRAYTYRFIKEEELDGRKCYVIEFISSPSKNVQDVSGKVWIDKETYEKRQIKIVQKNMTEPQVSNEEIDNYDYFESNGKKFNILSNIKAQQIFTVIGQTVTAEKEVRFYEVRINRDDFQDALNEAYKSDSPILQDTEKGYKYLHKNPDGTRSIMWEEKTGRFAAVGGAYYDKSLDYPLPFVGVNYFDYNYKKKNIQINLFLAGAVDSLSVSKNDIVPKLDFSLSGLIFLIPFKDRYFENGIEQKDQELKTFRQGISLTLGFRPTQFSNCKVTFDGKSIKFKTTSNSDDNFLKPKDHLDLSYGLSYDYSRLGWQLRGEWEGHKRSTWKNWGYGFSKEEIDNKKDYTLWGLTISKTFYLPKFQKIGLSLGFLDGSDLDRFSKYEFTYMGQRSLSGFTGSGIRFEKGYIAKTLYAFEVAKIVRISANIDYAKIKQNSYDTNWQNHLGLGFSSTFTGPWETVWSLDIGYALKSDIPKVEKDVTVGIVVLKLWGK